MTMVVEDLAPHIEAIAPPEVLLRGLEVLCSFICWTVLASAHRSKYGGRYEYDNYTPLNFLLAGAILHWGFSLGICILKRTNIFEAPLVESLEFFGSIATFIFSYTAAVAGAASSTQNHDEFADASICRPNSSSTNQKNKAAFFCAHVSAAVVFAFFTSAASAGSLYFLFAKRPQAQQTKSASAYNPIGGVDDDRDDVVPIPQDNDDAYANFHSPTTIPMEAISSHDHRPQDDDAAMDL